MSRPRALAAVGSLAATVAANLYLVFATLVLSLVALAFVWLPRGGRIYFRFARAWARGWLLAAGVTVRPRVEEGLESGGPYVYMVNHASVVDIPALLVTLPTPTRFLAKRSLFKIPVFGWSMKLAGFVDIDRQDLSRAGRSFSDSVRGMDGGFSLLVFPEGTRSPDGRLLPFQRGGFLLALKTGRAIVPVGVLGSARVQPKRTLRLRPGTIEIRYGRPIAVAEYGVRRRRELMEVVRREIAELAQVELRSA